MSVIGSGTMLRRSLRHHWLSHLAVLAGATVAAAVLTGALAVGDSVKYSLRRMALNRLGDIQMVHLGQSRFVRTELADLMAADLGTQVAPIVLLRGSATLQGSPETRSDTRAGHVQVVGSDERFWKLSPEEFAGPPASGVALNGRLARALGAKVGSEVLLRIDKPSLLSRDAPLSTVDDSTVALRMPVSAILNDAQFGRFSLAANQIPPLNAFVPITVLQEAVSVRGRANALLVGRTALDVDAAKATEAMWRHWDLADANLQLRELPAKIGGTELRTDRVFLDPAIGDAALRADAGAQGILTYFVNELRLGGRSTPYSTVTGKQMPDGMADDEIVLNDWTATDLAAGIGDRITLRFWVMGAQRKLIEQGATFRVRSIVPLAGAAADPDLMPPIPGLADKKNCRDWEPGVPVDLNKIRDKDQDYWAKHKGTPKAFITLAAAQKIWNNRFGSLTSVRYPSGSTSTDLSSHLRQALNPATLGIFFSPVRKLALDAGEQSLDFGQLFLGFSFFLIAAALLLCGLLFGLGVDRRAPETGALLALGLSPKWVRGLYLREGALLAGVAAILGAFGAAGYTRAVVNLLSGAWSGAVGGSDLVYHANPSTLMIGAVISWLAALGAIWLVVRNQARAPARVLLSGGTEESPASAARRSALGLPLAVGATIGAALLGFAGRSASHEAAAGLFFGAGALLLVAGLALARVLLAKAARRSGSISLSVGSLGMRGTARRPARSLSVVALLACGSFLVVAVGANRKDGSADAENKSSGTGGFALYGESSVPVYEDLNAPEGREAFALDDVGMAGSRVLPLRVQEGDEASCLNLNRAQVPRLLGVEPSALAGRFTIGAAAKGLDVKSGWQLLNSQQPDGAVPAIADANTLTWSLGKSVGDTLEYFDERGASRKLRFVATVSGSILQGGVLVSERSFLDLFPSQSGYQVFLIDAPSKGVEAGKELTAGLEDVGFSAMLSADRLNDFNAVENTYLSIFGALGGLGLLLGTFGLGVVVLRNVLERRGELAVLMAMGLGKGRVFKMLYAEHSALLGLGIAVGTLAGLLAVLPVRSAGAASPVLSLLLTLLAVLETGLFCTWVSATLALRGSLIGGLRSE